MRPTSSAAVYRPDLGQAVMEYADDGTLQPIGLMVMPLFPTRKHAGSFPVIPKEALLKLPDTARAPRGSYNRDDFDYERGTYLTTENGWEEPLDDDERDMFDEEAPGAADDVAVQRAWEVIMRGQEKRIADKVFSATNFTANAVSNEWETANGVPITDVNDARSAIRLQCGMLPNALVVGWTVFQNLKNNAQIVDRLKYTFPGIDLNRMSSEQLAAIFDLKYVLVGGMVYDSKGKGKAANIADLWDDEYAMLTRVSESRNLREPCIGRTMLWSADTPVNPIVETYREEKIRSDVYRVRHNTDEKLLASVNSSGTEVSKIYQAVSYLMSNITA